VGLQEAQTGRRPVGGRSRAADRLVLAASRNPFWEAAVLVLADAGLKSDELLALEPADVYLSDGSGEQGYLVVRRTREAKRLRARTLRLTPRLRSALRRCLDEQGAGPGPLFPVTPRAVNSMLESLTGLAGLRRGGRVTPEMLRASFAVRHARRHLAAEAAAAARGLPEAELRAPRPARPRAPRAARPERGRSGARGAGRRQVPAAGRTGARTTMNGCYAAVIEPLLLCKMRERGRA
jgi:integrase